MIISSTLIDLIWKSAYKILVKSQPDITIQDVLNITPIQGHSGWSYVEAQGDEQYSFFKTFDYDWIGVSESDPQRLSGIPIRKRIFSAPPSSVERKRLGVYLKPSKIIERLFFWTLDYQANLCSELSWHLRLAYPDPALTVKVGTNFGDVYAHSVSSCMSGKPDSFFDIYRVCGFKIAYVTGEEGRCKARALIHDEVIVGHPIESVSTIKFMDQVYYNDPNARAAMISWAMKNGYWCKTRNYNNEICIKDPDDNEMVAEVSVRCKDLRKSSLSNVPYIDTFHYFVRRWGRYYLSVNSDGRIATLLNTNGSDNMSKLVPNQRCSQCGNRVYPDLTPDGELLCVACLSNERIATCSVCQGRYRHHLHRHVTYQGRWVEVCSTCWNERTFRCGECGGREHDDNLMLRFFFFRICRDCYDIIYPPTSKGWRGLVRKVNDLINRYAEG